MSTGFIWEDKSIIIGIFVYLIKYHDILKKYRRRVVIDNFPYRNIIQFFFFDLKIRKQNKPHYKKPLIINIKNVRDEGSIYINNINNFRDLNSKKIRILPWYDLDNPVVIFEKMENYERDVDIVKKDITYFTKYIRRLPTGIRGSTKGNCIVDIWDAYYEIKILDLFVKKYKRIFFPFGILHISKTIELKVYGQKRLIPLIVFILNSKINEMLTFPVCNKNITTQIIPIYIPCMNEYEHKPYIPEYYEIIKEIVEKIQNIRKTKVIDKELQDKLIKIEKEISEKGEGKECENKIIEKDNIINIKDELLKLVNKKLDTVNTLMTYTG